MKYILIRHPKPLIDAKLCYGQSDLDINDSDISEIIENIKELNISDHLCYSSPLMRCYKVAKVFDQEVKSDKRLMELNFNDWELKNWDDIDRDEIDQWSKDIRDFRPGNGESYNDLLNRVKTFIDEMNSINRPLIIFTHAGVIRAFMEIIENRPIEESLKLKLPYGSIYLI